VQSHCDDLAVVATSSTLQSIQDSLHTYERSSGALLNSSKSFLITKQHLPNSHSPHPPSHDDNSRGRYVLPPHLIDECTEALQRIKKLPLSLAGRMTALSLYIRPRLLYRLGITSSRGMSSYLLVELWFLSASREFIPGSMPSPIFSIKSLPIHHSTFAFDLSLSASTFTDFPSSCVPLRSVSPSAILLPSDGYPGPSTQTASALSSVSLEHSIICHHITDCPHPVILNSDRP